MNISEVPEGQWMLIDNDKKLLFYNKSIEKVCRKGRKQPLGDVWLKQKK